MKSAANVVLIVCIFAGLSCSSTGNTAEGLEGVPRDAIVDVNNSMQSLADYLRRIPGVSVRTVNGEIAVNIRGRFHLTEGYREPLYVINGIVSSSSNYSEVSRMVDVREIYYVRVLKGTDAAIYGARGGNGVVEIVTK